jgi:hypothetical protein
MKIINCSQINFFIEFLNRLVVVNLNCNNLKQKKIYLYWKVRSYGNDRKHYHINIMNKSKNLVLIDTWNKWLKG